MSSQGTNKFKRVLETPESKLFSSEKLEVETGFEPVGLQLCRLLLWAAQPLHRASQGFTPIRADDEIRTRDPHLGKVMLYQLSHIRMPSFEDLTTIEDSETVCKPGQMRVAGRFIGDKRRRNSYLRCPI